MIHPDPLQIPEDLKKILRSIEYITILTGAGVSAESGIPTFRDAQTGLWSRYDPHELASPQAFQKNPKLVWEWYQWRRDLILRSNPNPAHIAIAHIEKHIPKFTLITQNVDGLHEAAGSRNILELHGNIHRTKCFNENIIIEEWKDTAEIPPRCPNCGGYLRPDVVWFGEILSPDILGKANLAASKCEIFISVGTSGIVEPAASLPSIALRSGAIFIEVNTGETPLSRFADYVFRIAAGKILPEFSRLIINRNTKNKDD
jgi:NAD-dependent deacetylase